MKYGILSALALCIGVSAGATDNFRAGKTLFDARCTELCHQTPGEVRLQPEQWRIVLKTMQTRMKDSDMPSLTDEEFEQLYTYLVNRQ